MNITNLDMMAGEARTFTLYARDVNNDVRDLTGATLSWRVGRAPFDPASNVPVFTIAGTIVSASAGSFTVALANADTVSLDGDFLHQAVTSTNIVVVSGRLHIRPALGV